MATSTTKLFKIITNNDYQTLGHLIENRGTNKTNFNCVKSTISLIHHAIEYRAKECFDLLVGIPDYHTLLKTDSNGLQIACQYYINAPNPSNEYYINKMISANAYVGVNALIAVISNTELFKLLFNLAEKKLETINNLMNLCIHYNSNLEIITVVHNYIVSNLVINYASIIESSINRDNVSVIDYLFGLGNLSMTSPNGDPYIYIAIQKNACNIFTYLFDKLKLMSSEELNKINKIQELSLIKDPYNRYLTKQDYIKSLVKLPISYTPTFIKMQFNEFFKINSYSTNIYPYKISTRFNLKLSTIYELCKINYGTKNLMPKGFHCIDKFITDYNLQTPVWKRDANEYLRKLFYIYNHYNLEIDAEVKKIYDIVFTKEQLIPSNFNTDRDAYIKFFEPVVKARKPRKKPTNIEL